MLALSCSNTSNEARSLCNKLISASQLYFILFFYPPERPLLDSKNLEHEGSHQDSKPDNLQLGRYATSSSQSQLLGVAQHPQACTRSPPLPQLVYGHTVDSAKSRDFPEKGDIEYTNLLVLSFLHF